ARVDRPLDLITLDTERNQHLRMADMSPVSRLIRTRTVIYVAILAVLGLGVLFGLTTRDSLDLNVLPDRNPLFVKLADGRIRNGYTVKVLNQVREPKTYALTLEGLEGATLDVLGLAKGDRRMAVLDARPDQVSTYRVFVTAPPTSALEAVQDLHVVLTDEDGGETFGFETIFRGPE
ncbi:MAG: FixG Ig-like domain-containing protein, partial [Geminicoccaceae bacterium]